MNAAIQLLTTFPQINKLFTTLPSLGEKETLTANIGDASAEFLGNTPRLRDGLNPHQNSTRNASNLCHPDNKTRMNFS